MFFWVVFAVEFWVVVDEGADEVLEDYHEDGEAEEDGPEEGGGCVFEIVGILTGFGVFFLETTD